MLNLLNELPVVHLDRILGSARVEVKLRAMAYEDGTLPLRDAVPLLSILALENPAEVLEIGTYMGRTTRAMADNMSAGVVHTVDLPEDFPADATAPSPLPKDDFHLIAKRVVGREFKKHSGGAQIVQHFGDTALLDFSEMGQPTFFFIDGAHTYEYCKNDSEKCLALSRPGATFLWHDCDRHHPGILQFLHEWRREGRDIVRIEGTILAYWKRPV